LSKQRLQVHLEIFIDPADPNVRYDQNWPEHLLGIEDIVCTKLLDLSIRERVDLLSGGLPNITFILAGKIIASATNRVELAHPLREF
jgi:hypothetical protein